MLRIVPVLIRRLWPLMDWVAVGGWLAEKRGRSGRRLLHKRIQGRPDESRQFARHRHDPFCWWFALGRQPMVPMVKPQHRPIGDGDHRWRLALAPVLKRPVLLWTMPIV